jgi:TolA-binding protein
MNTKLAPWSKYVQVDTSAARMARLWTSVSHQLGSKPLYRRRPVFAMVAAAGLSLGAAAGYGWVTWWGPGAALLSSAVLQTATDQLTVELGKGISLRLAAHSRVQLLSGDDDRVSLRLEQGTITCELTAHGKRRFAVLVADLEVRDTGTRFTVTHDSSNANVEVTVERGSVEIVGTAGHGRTTSISAGEHWVRQGRAQGATGAASSPLASNIGISPGALAPISASSSDAVSTASNAREEQAPRNVAPDPVEPPTAQALLEQASTARRAGNPALAGRSLQTLIARYPNDTRVGLAALELGRLRMGPLADTPGAVRALQTALAHAPSAGFREDALAHLIEAHAALGDTAQCRTLCQRYLTEYPAGVHRVLVERKCRNP